MCQSVDVAVLDPLGCLSLGGVATHLVDIY